MRLSLSGSALSRIGQLTNLSLLCSRLRLQRTTNLSVFSTLTRLRRLELIVCQDPEMMGEPPTWMLSLPVSLRKLAVTFKPNIASRSPGVRLRPLRSATLGMCFQHIARLTELNVLSLITYAPFDFKPEELKVIAHLPLQRVCLGCADLDETQRATEQALREACAILKPAQLTFEFDITS